MCAPFSELLSNISTGLHLDYRDILKFVKDLTFLLFFSKKSSLLPKQYEKAFGWIRRISYCLLFYFTGSILLEEARGVIDPEDSYEIR